MGEMLGNLRRTHMLGLINEEDIGKEVIVNEIGRAHV